MAIKFMSLEEKEKSKFYSETFFKISYFPFRYTEIWNDDEGSKGIKLADPKLNGYYEYPELVLVDTKFCVKP